MQEPVSVLRQRLRAKPESAPLARHGTIEVLTQVGAQDHQRSLFNLAGRLIGLRRSLRGHFSLLEVDDERLLYRRGRHLIDVNFGPVERRLEAGRHVLSTEDLSEVRFVPAFGGDVLESPE